MVGLEMSDRGLSGAAPRRRLCPRPPRGLRRLRRDVRQDVPALTQTAELAASRRQLLADGAGIAVSAIGFGFVYGLSAREAGFSPLEAMAMSVIVFAGAAQFAAGGDVARGPGGARGNPFAPPPQARPPLFFAGPSPRLPRGRG